MRNIKRLRTLLKIISPVIGQDLEKKLLTFKFRLNEVM